MGVEESMNQLVTVPIALLWGSFVCGCIFYFILDGVSGIVHCIIEKTIQKIKSKKEKENNV